MACCTGRRDCSTSYRECRKLLSFCPGDGAEDVVGEGADLGVGGVEHVAELVAGGLAEDEAARNRCVVQDAICTSRCAPRGVSRIASAMSCTAARKGRRRLSSTAITAI